MVHEHLLGRATAHAAQIPTTEAALPMEMEAVPLMVESVTVHPPGTPDLVRPTTLALATMLSHQDRAHRLGAVPVPATEPLPGEVYPTAETSETTMMLPPPADTLPRHQGHTVLPPPALHQHQVLGVTMLPRQAELSVRLRLVVYLNAVVTTPPPQRPTMPQLLQWEAQLLLLGLVMAMTTAVRDMMMAHRAHSLALAILFAFCLVTLSFLNKFSPQKLASRIFLRYQDGMDRLRICILFGKMSFLQNNSR